MIKSRALSHFLMTRVSVCLYACECLSVYALILSSRCSVHQSSLPPPTPTPTAAATIHEVLSIAVSQAPQVRYRSFPRDAFSCFFISPPLWFGLVRVVFRTIYIQGIDWYPRFVVFQERGEGEEGEEGEKKKLQKQINANKQPAMMNSRHFVPKSEKVDLCPFYSKPCSCSWIFVVG
ncbi:hypothetical protein F5Y14DRAFT_125568 [Nemania sp. NC0429]|nr:hypothetical protein F5Y14DRAFT_125568 [Nemania sp. NC0429]